MDLDRQFQRHADAFGEVLSLTLMSLAVLASSSVEVTPVSLFSKKNLISALTSAGDFSSGTIPGRPPGTFWAALESVMPLVAAKNFAIAFFSAFFCGFGVAALHGTGFSIGTFFVPRTTSPPFGGRDMHLSTPAVV